MLRHIVVTNNGGSSCTITGYPAAFLTDTHGVALGDGAAPHPLYTPATITLVSHATAHVVMGFPDAGNFSSGECSATSASLQLYVPGSADALTTPLAAQNCPGFSVTAFQSGS